MNNIADQPSGHSTGERNKKQSKCLNLMGIAPKLAEKKAQLAFCLHQCLSDENEHEISMFPAQPLTAPPTLHCLRGVPPSPVAVSLVHACGRRPQSAGL